MTGLILITLLCILVQLGLATPASQVCCEANCPGGFDVCQDSRGTAYNVSTFHRVGQTILKINSNRNIFRPSVNGSQHQFHCAGSLGQIGCESSCLFNGTFATCSGDSVFCENHTCTTGQNADCDCWAEYGDYVEQCLISGQWASCGSPVVTTLRTSFRDIQPERPTVVYRQTRHLLTGDQVFCTSSFDSNTYIMTATCSHETSVRFEKTPWRTSLSIQPGKTVLMVLPKSERLTSGSLIIICDYLGQSVISDEYQVTGVVDCELTDCFFCLKSLSEYSCLPKTKKFFVIGGMSAFVSFVSVCILFLSVHFMCCAKIGSGCFMGAKLIIKGTTCNFCNCCRKVNNNQVNTELAPILADETADDEERIRAEVKEKLMKHMPKPNFGIRNSAIFLLFLVCQPTDSCDVGMLLHVDSTTCTTNGDSQSCQLMTELTMTIAQAGGTVCFNVIDREKGLALGQIAVKYQALQVSYPLATQYYTADWEGFFASSHYCYNSGPCDHATICNDVAPGDLNPYQLFNDARVTDRPGISSCRRSCQCISCDCFYCVPSCVFSRWALSPKGVPWRVSSISSNPQIVYWVTITKKMPNEALNTDLFSGAWTFNGDRTLGEWVVNVAGSLLVSIPSMSSRSLVTTTDNSQAFIMNAAPAGAPQKNMPGDIQSSSAAGILTPNHQSFIFDYSLATAAEGDHYSTFYFPQSGLVTSPKGILPGSYEGNYWWVDSTLKANLSSTSALFLTLKTTVPVTFTRSKNLVCPQIEFVSVVGCSSCNTGFQVRLNVWSSCSSGSAFVTTNKPAITIYNSFVVLWESKSNFVVTGNTPYVNNDFKLIITAGDFTSEVAVSFVAPEGTGSFNMTWVKGTATGTTDSSKLSWFDWAFDRLFSNSWLLMIMELLLVILAVSLAIFLSRKAIQRSFMSSTGYQKL